MGGGQTLVKGLKVWIGKQEGRKGVGTFSPTDGQSWSLG